MRKGIYTFDPKKISGMNTAIKYFGMHVSNCIVGFTYIFFLMGICLMPLFWPLFWILIWNYIPIVLLMIVSSLAISLSKLLAQKCVIARDHIMFRRLFY